MTARKTKKKPDEEPNLHNRELAAKGEDAAAQFMQRRGYDIVARNWTCPFGEADIVARDFETLVFVEVKTRVGIDKGVPEEAVTAEKRKKYEKIAMAFLLEYGDSDLQVRFDVVAIVVMGKNKAFIRHHINAFGVG